MLPKKFRFSKKEGEDIFRKGKLFHSPNFVVRVARNELDFSRFCFVVSRKDEKKATRRNWLKRRIYGIIRNRTRDVNKGFDFLIIKRKNHPLTKDYRELEAELLGLLIRAGREK